MDSRICTFVTFQFNSGVIRICKICWHFCQISSLKRYSLLLQFKTTATTTNIEFYSQHLIKIASFYHFTLKIIPKSSNIFPKLYDACLWFSPKNHFTLRQNIKPSIRIFIPVLYLVPTCLPTSNSNICTRCFKKAQATLYNIFDILFYIYVLLPVTICFVEWSPKKEATIYLRPCSTLHSKAINKKSTCASLSMCICLTVLSAKPAHINKTECVLDSKYWKSTPSVRQRSQWTKAVSRWKGLR